MIMNKQFSRFSATVPDDFEEQMIQFWMSDEGQTREEAISSYYDDNFKELLGRIKGNKCSFKPDLGYRDSEIEGSLCFEVEDDNFCIPVSILS